MKRTPRGHITTSPDHELTAAVLREALSYDPLTGHFTWIKKVSDKVIVGNRAGNAVGRGYRQIRLYHISHLEHRLAFLYSIGRWPAQDLDHINGIKSDNRMANLREVTASVNQQNRRAPQANCKSGFLGVRKCGNAWTAQIGIRRRYTHLGTFSTPELAHAAYLEAKRRMHPGYVAAKDLPA